MNLQEGQVEISPGVWRGKHQWHQPVMPWQRPPNARDQDWPILPHGREIMSLAEKADPDGLHHGKGMHQPLIIKFSLTESIFSTRTLRATGRAMKEVRRTHKTPAARAKKDAITDKMIISLVTRHWPSLPYVERENVWWTGEEGGRPAQLQDILPDHHIIRWRWRLAEGFISKDEEEAWYKRQCPDNPEGFRQKCMSYTEPTYQKGRRQWLTYHCFLINALHPHTLHLTPNTSPMSS